MHAPDIRHLKSPIACVIWYQIIYDTKSSLSKSMQLSIYPVGQRWTLHVEWKIATVDFTGHIQRLLYCKHRNFFS